MSLATNCLGKYRLIAELGRGGMAEVFLAVAEGPGGFNKLVVLKRIRPQLAEDPDFLNMFLDEARLAARLNHPNIVQTNEVGQEAGQYFIAMEYLEGQPLNRVRSRLDRHQGGLPLGLHLRIVCEVLRALHYAHELTDYDGTPLGVVHRDASPHNTFITYNGQIKLVDFGIAKAMNSTAETRAGMLKGKVPYMAPEQARGEGVDRRADIFSVGVMIWEALAGRRLWKDKPDVSVLKWLVDAAPDPLPSPRRYNVETPAILEQICLRALSPNRDSRQATALELQHELEHALASVLELQNVREAGALVSQYFADERARIRAIIEGQLRVARDLATSRYRHMNIPQLGPATISGTPSGAYTPSTPSQGGYTPSSPGQQQPTSGVVSNAPRGAPSAQELVPTPSQDELSIETEPTASPSALSHSGMPAAAVPSFGLGTSASAAALAAAVQPEQGASRRWPLLAAGGVVAVVVGAGAGVLALSAASDPAAGQETAPALAPTSPSSTAGGSTQFAQAPGTGQVESSEITVSVTASPKHARIFIDDQQVPANPYEAQVAGDGKKHEIRVAAKGYEEETREVTFDRDLDLDFELTKKRGRPVAASPRPRPPTPPEPTAEPDEPPAGEPEDDDWMKKRWPKADRPIDNDNPYKR